MNARVPVSSASIRRAESGKNVLYRTAANLARFFDVSIEQLSQATTVCTENIKPESQKAIIFQCYRESFSINTSKTIIVAMQFRHEQSVQRIIQLLQHYSLRCEHSGLYLNVRISADANISAFEKTRQLAHCLQQTLGAGIRVSLQCLTPDIAQNIASQNPSQAELVHILASIPWAAVCVCEHVLASGYFQPLRQFRPKLMSRQCWYIVSTAREAAAFIGREKQLVWCEQSLDNFYRQGKGGVICIDGEPGSGKSTFLKNCLDIATIRQAINVIHLDFAQVYCISGRTPLQRTIIQFLACSDQVDDATLWQVIMTSLSSRIAQVSAAYLLGLEIGEAELSFLKYSSDHIKKQHITTLINELISLRSPPGIVVVVDNIHLGERGVVDGQLSLFVIDALAKAAQEHAILMFVSGAKHIEGSFQGDHWRQAQWILLGALPDYQMHKLSTLIAEDLVVLAAEENLIRQEAHTQTDQSGFIAASDGRPHLLKQRLLSAQNPSLLKRLQNDEFARRVEDLPKNAFLLLDLVAILDTKADWLCVLSLLPLLAIEPSVEPCNTGVKTSFTSSSSELVNKLVQAEVIVRVGSFLRFSSAWQRERVLTCMHREYKMSLHSLCGQWFADKDLDAQRYHLGQVGSAQAKETLLRMAEQAVARKEYTLALNCLRSATTLLVEYEHVNFYFLQVCCHRRLGQWDEIIQVYLHLLAMPKGKDDALCPKLQYIAVQTIFAYIFLGQDVAALALLKKCERENKKHSGLSRLFSLNSCRGFIYAERGALYGGSISRAEKQYRQALSPNPDNICKLTHGQALSGLAYCAYIDGNFSAALEHAHASLPLSESLVDLETLAQSYTTLAGVYFFQQQYNEAMQYAQKALLFGECCHLPKVQLQARLWCSRLLLARYPIPRADNLKRIQLNIDQGYSQAEDLSMPTYSAMFLHQQAILQLSQKKFFDACATIESALARLTLSQVNTHQDIPCFKLVVLALKVQVQAFMGAGGGEPEEVLRCLNSLRTLDCEWQAYQSLLEAAWVQRDMKKLRRYCQKLKQLYQHAKSPLLDNYVKRAEMMLTLLEGGVIVNDVDEHNCRAVRINWPVMQLQLDRNMEILGV